MNYRDWYLVLIDPDTPTCRTGVIDVDAQTISGYPISPVAFEGLLMAMREFYEASQAARAAARADESTRT